MQKPVAPPSQENQESTIRRPDDEYFRGKSIVVDGQQRLTTLLVMMKVIALLTNDAMVFEAFFTTKNRKKGFKAASLRLGPKDRPDFERILALEKLEGINGASHVISAYDYFRTHIDKGLADTMNLGLMTDLIVFTTITVDDAKNDWRIFETINSLGARLAAAELFEKEKPR